MLLTTRGASFLFVWVFLSHVLHVKQLTCDGSLTRGVMTDVKKRWQAGMLDVACGASLLLIERISCTTGDVRVSMQAVVRGPALRKYEGR